MLVTAANVCIAANAEEKNEEIELHLSTKEYLRRKLLDIGIRRHVTMLAEGSTVATVDTAAVRAESPAFPSRGLYLFPYFTPTMTLILTSTRLARSSKRFQLNISSTLQ